MNKQRTEAVIHNLAIILLEETNDKEDILHLLTCAGLNLNELKQFDLEWMLEKYEY